ncbi:hypothetical protein F5878DRAFT_399317 [Lentinula raphanica]|uniref:Secreted protein n=1 Tax=Lentinula raphanica TaxID=153919 RepID=A0AA38UCP8_9AGAR|nr:hypothetical protein F5878DRAFT_399317 [Lentinula raphanica]
MHHHRVSCCAFSCLFLSVHHSKSAFYIARPSVMTEFGARRRPNFQMHSTRLHVLISLHFCSQLNLSLKILIILLSIEHYSSAHNVHIVCITRTRI